MSVSISDFGQTRNNEKASLYTITNSKGMRACVTDFGAILVSLYVPDRDGRYDDVVLGFSNVCDYEFNPSFFGSTIGRYANRIAGAKFTLNGVTYKLERNNGKNNLHSDFRYCFNKKMFKGEAVADNSVRFSISSPDGDQGFPGNVEATVTYTVTEDNGLDIEYTAVSDADTVYNITNHSYFNLGGHASGKAMDMKLQLNASKYTPTDAGSIPTGEIAKVKGTPFDFTKLTTIGDRIDNDDMQLKFGHGYDHNFALDKKSGEYAQIATLKDEKTGRVMKTYTDLPGVQFYAGNFIKKQKGKDGVVYGRRHAVCLETQYFPDAVNQPKFEKPLLKKGDKFYSKTRYEFSVEK